MTTTRNEESLLVGQSAIIVGAARCIVYGVCTIAFGYASNLDYLVCLCASMAVS